MSASQKELVNFKKETKRDQSPYPIFKSEQHYDSFCMAVNDNAKAQGYSSPSIMTHLHMRHLMTNSHSCTQPWLVTTLQTECVRELTKEFEGENP